MSTTTETRTANERLARLLGWEKTGVWYGYANSTAEAWGHPDHDDSWGAPDYTTWDRFPELQAYVRGLGYRQRVAITDQMRWPSTGIRYSWWDITPEILGNAILEVCDE